MMCGYLYKDNYIKKILQVKVPTIIVWCVFSAMCAIIFNLLIQETVSVGDVLLCFIGNRILNWFFASLILHCLLFIISVKLAKDKVNTVSVITFVMTCVYMIAFRVLVKRTSWYASSLAFPTGVYIAYCYSKDQTRICKIFQEHQKHIVLVVLLFTFFFSGFFLTGMTLEVRLIRLFCELISAEVFAVAGILLCCNKKSKGDPIMVWKEKRTDTFYAKYLPVCVSQYIDLG